MLTIGMALAATVAWGAETIATVRSVDPGQKRVVLDDGTQLWVAPGMSLDLFVQGRRVKVSFEERDGKKWVRSVEAVN
jgi:hypothetical protein